MNAAHKPRPKYYEFNLAHHWPPAVVSIFHRISGALLFLLLPVLLWVLQRSLASEAEFGRVHAWIGHPLVKLAAIAVAWACAHHFVAGVRYLILDTHIGMGRESARRSAIAVFVIEAILVLAFAAWIW